MQGIPLIRACVNEIVEMYGKLWNITSPTSRAENMVRITNEWYERFIQRSHQPEIMYYLQPEDFLRLVIKALNANERGKKFVVRPLDVLCCDVNCKYGAPMGRRVQEVARIDSKVYDCAVPLVDGYDKGGAYWGIPNNLRVQYTTDLTYVNFYRKGEQ